MEFKKVFDQTVREFKREVNKVLKVPEIEQKVLDATSNEPWGPHGTVMADIAQATRNYNDYQMIMSILWKRINDIGRNWRHVYKALTLLEFLVAHGSERVIDELKEHAYQLSTLADFQYIDSSGKDQGLNVRKKSQSLVVLVNDKDKIREARQKAAENRDKYRGVSSTGGMYKPSSYHSTGGSYGGNRYEEESYGSNSRYGSYEDERYGRDRDGDRYRDEDRYGRDWDRSGRDSDRSSRGGDRWKDDSNRDYDREDDRYRSEKYRSYDRDRDRAYDDDDRHSSRSGGGRGDDYGGEERRTDRKPSDAKMPAPPSYEDTLGSPEYRAAEEPRDEGGLAAAAARASRSNSSEANIVSKTLPAVGRNDEFDEFDPRSSAAVPGPSALVFQVDQFSSLAEQGAPVQAVVPPPATSLSSALSSSSTDLFGESSTSSFAPPATVMQIQDLDRDVFGDSPFRVETSVLTSASITPSSGNPHLSVSGNGGAPGVIMGPGSFNAYAPPALPNQHMPAPPSVISHPGPAPFVGGSLYGDDSFSATFGSASNGAPMAARSMNTLGSLQVSHNLAAPTGPSQSLLGMSQQAPKVVPATKPQQEKKFETKSTVWADTLSKGLIDLNIAGPKSNPLADIGIDFDLLRTERIKEERASAKSSTVTMGKAMGAGSGLGVAGAGAIAPPAAPMMMAPGMGMTAPMGMGMGMRPPVGPGIGMMNPMMQQMGLSSGMPVRPGAGAGMGMGMNSSMGMGMGMGMGAYPNQQQQYSGFR